MFTNCIRYVKYSTKCGNKVNASSEVNGKERHICSYSGWKRRETMERNRGEGGGWGTKNYFTKKKKKITYDLKGKPSRIHLF